MNSQQVLEVIKSILALVWAYDGVKVIVSTIGINVVVALAAALKSGDFQIGRLAEFLTKKLLPYVAIYFAIKAFGEAAGLSALAPIVWGIIELTLAGDLADSLSQLGINWPPVLAKFIVKE